MALPSQVEVPPDAGPGSRRIDYCMTEETARKLEQRFPQISWLGAGCSGIAFECLPGIVCKLTELDWEADRSQAQRAGSPGAAPISLVEQIQADPELWLIMSKKVQELSTPERYALSFANTDHVMDSLEIWTAVAQARKLLRKHRLDDKMIGPELIERMNQAFVQCKSELEGARIPITDTHPDNFGWDAGNLVFFDFG